MEHKGNFILLSGLLIITLLVCAAGTTFSYLGAKANNSEGTTTIINSKGIVNAQFDPDINVGMVNAGETLFTKRFVISGSTSTSDNVTYELDLDVSNNSYPGNVLVYTINSTKDNGLAIPSSTAPVEIPAGSSRIKIGSGSFSGPVNGGKHEYVITIYRKSDAPIMDGEASSFNAQLKVVEAV